MANLNVTLFNRKPLAAYYSVERLFQDVTRAFPPDIVWKSVTSRFESRGFFRRLYNLVEAYFRQGKINHITGDVHYLAYFLKKNRTILTVLDCNGLERLNGIRKTVFFYLWYWLPAKRVSRITVISESTKKELLRYISFDESKIRVIHCCISNTFKAAEKVFNGTLPVFLQLGTSANKNLLGVAEALSGFPCHLRIIGKLTEEQSSKLEACKIDYSNSYNLSDAEIIDEYKKSDALIFASTYEGFGLPIVEANAIGRPVITSNILSMPEVAGNAACLVDPFDVHDIRRGVMRIIHDENYRNSLIENGYANAQRFKPDVIAQQYTELYREIFAMQNKRGSS